MFGAISVLISAGAATAATAYGYIQARVFTRKRLRFVESAQSGVAPVIAGVGALILGAIITAFLPFVGIGTALLFGAGVGVGVASGQSDIRHRRLNP